MNESRSARTEHRFGSQDATGLSRGASRWLLQPRLAVFKMPRACPVESHVASYSSGERETPRDKPVASSALRSACSSQRNDPRDKPVALMRAAFFGVVTVVVFCLLPLALSAQQQPQGPPPQRPPQAKPARKQVLAWGDQRFGVQHDAVTRALVTMERLGRESGAYDMCIRTDSQLITKQPITMPGSTRPTTNKNLNWFDAIFFYGVREIELTEQQKADLMSFIKEDGKGFVGAHTATTAFFSWPEFGEMIGARFDEHPWGVFEASVIIDDPLFPAMKHFPKISVIKDEHYQHKDFSRDKIRVLAHLDASKLDLKNPRVRRADGDFPVAWSKMHGKGRVFYSTLGHAPEFWDDPQIQKMYFEAIKWSLGLSEGETKPLAGK